MNILNYSFFSLPRIQEQIESLLELTREQYSKLPPEPSDDPVNELLLMLSEFQKDVDSEIKGTTFGNGLLQKILCHLDDFRFELRGTAPRFIPFEKGSPHAKQLPEMGFLHVEEQDLDTRGTFAIVYLDDVEKLVREYVDLLLPRVILIASPLVPHRENFQETCLLMSSVCSLANSSPNGIHLGQGYSARLSLL